MIREARASDIDSIISLCAAHAAYEKSDYNPENKAERLANELFGENPRLHCLVVEDDGLIVGYATYIIQYSTWDASEYIYMDCLYLHEKYRGKKIGEMLMQKIAALGKEYNCDLMQWHTPVFNEGAIRFYKRTGAVSKSKERFYLSI